MQPLVSVVIPSYNHAAFVGESVRSVLTQEVDALELIVVDDGSRDDSLALLRAIDDPRMRVIAQENRGAHLALDRGLREARGQYLGILNSDDRYAPGRLRAALAALRADPSLALVGSWVEVIDAEGRVLGVKQGYLNMDPWPSPEPARTFKADESLWTALLMQNYWATTSNYVMPRATYERHGPFRPLRYAHDWDFALRVQREQPALLLADPLLQYRIHGSNTIRDNRAAMIYEVCWILANHLPRYLGEAGFWAAGRERRTEQLLASIGVYGCDRVLWAMLAQIHFGPPESELELLREGDPSRGRLLDEIRRVLQEQDERATTTAAPPPSMPTPPSQPQRDLLGGLLRRIKR